MADLWQSRDDCRTRRPQQNRAPAPRVAKAIESAVLPDPENSRLAVERQLSASVMSAMSAPYRLFVRAPAIARARATVGRINPTAHQLHNEFLHGLIPIPRGNSRRRELAAIATAPNSSAASSNPRRPGLSAEPSCGPRTARQIWHSSRQPDCQMHTFQRCGPA
jgi:hypothetical protein